jgi:hypothetical protein
MKLIYYPYVFTGSHSRPPQLIPESSDTKEVHTGDDIDLGCESDEPIWWSYPRLNFTTVEVQCDLLI